MFDTRAPTDPPLSPPIDGAGLPAADWVLADKLEPPPQHISAVARQALIERLDRAIELPLTVLLSPPGFGKTTLASQWYQHLKDRNDTRMAWLSLDEDDGEVTHFLAYLALALSGAGIELGPWLQTVRTQWHALDARATITMLLGAIRKAPHKLVIVLDDYDRAGGRAVDEAVLRLIQHGGPRLHLLLATRTPPALPLARFSVRGLVERIGARELAFDDREAQAMLGTQLGPVAVQQLQQRTEGWPVALQLALLWATGNRHPFSDLAQVSGRSAEIADYLTEQVLRDLDEPLRDLLLKTSLLDRFNVSLANAVRASTDSGLQLSRLSRFHGLLIPLDAEHLWFRYHRLFADYLHQRLQQDAPDQVASLHLRASHWFTNEGNLLEAVKHAARAGDIELAAGFIARAGCWELMLRHGLGYVRSLLRLFGRKTVLDTPALNLTQAYLHMKLGEFSHAQLLLERFRALPVEVRAPFDRDYTLVVALLRDLLDEICLDPKGAQRIAAQAAALDSDDFIGRGTLLCISATTALGRGDFAAAEGYALQARHDMQQADNATGAGYALLHLGQSYYQRGLLERAESTYRESLALAERSADLDHTLRSAGLCLMAQLQCERGRYEAAAENLEPALAFLEQHDGWFDVFVAGYATALALARRHDRTARTALALLERMERTARARHLARLLDLALAWRLEVLLDQVPAPSIDPLIASSGSESHFHHALRHSHAWQQRAALGFALARWHQHGRNQTALNLLSSLQVACADSGNQLHLARAHARIALVQQQRGEVEQALPHLGQALDHIAQTQAWHTVLELGLPAKAMLRMARQRDPQAAAGTSRSQVIRTLLDMLNQEDEAVLGLFSGREREVLAELGRGHSNKQIARLLNLSENTVKFHLKNIYRKLGADSRAAALAVSRQRGLIPASTPAVPLP